MCRITLRIMLKLVEIELLLKLIYSTASVNELLLTGKERMAFRANINLNVILNGLGNIFCATSTLNSCSVVFGMETLLHFKFPLFHIIKGFRPTFHK